MDDFRPIWTVVITNELPASIPTWDVRSCCLGTRWITIATRNVGSAPPHVHTAREWCLWLSWRLEQFTNAYQ